MALTTAEFSETLVTALVDQSVPIDDAIALTGTITTALINWLGGDALTVDLANRLAITVDEWRAFISTLRDWSGGTATGGPNSDGEYPLSNGAGGVTMIASPAKMVSVTEKGDPARNDVGFTTQLTLAAKEVIPGPQVAYPSVFVVAKCNARCKTQPTATAIMHIKKNMAPGVDPATVGDWGTITFEPGSYVGTFAIADPNLVEDDWIDFVGPYTADPTLGYLSITLAGS